ncbi:hypothetical protein Q7P37_001694 [Cladosporium fusiforme]
MFLHIALPILAAAGTSVAAAIPSQSANENFVARRAVSGESTFYGGNVQGGTCSFSTYTLPDGLYGTAFSGQAWDNGANCGGCVEVSHGGKKITAMIVDQCPECDEGHLDLFEDAFEVLADKSEGIIDTSYEFVDCPKVSGPLTIHTKSGVSPYWFSAQVVNANRRTSKLEVSTDGSSWEEAERTEYNFFEIPSGVGSDSASVRVTSEDGSSVIVEDVKMEAGVSAEASSNYE